MIDLARHAARELRKIGVQIDWKATFEAFVEAHGGMPVRHGGRLLFADGWGHALDYRGPEFPPPDAGTPEGAAELARLKYTYQVLKRKALIMERDWLLGVIETFDQTQRLRSAPLQRRYRTDDRDEHGNPRWGTGPAAAGVEPLRLRLEHVTLPALRECEAEIRRTEEASCAI